jgi:hypothetical protein
MSPRRDGEPEDGRPNAFTLWLDGLLDTAETQVSIWERTLRHAQALLAPRHRLPQDASSGQDE